MDNTHFEVISSNGQRFRFSADKYHWQYCIKTGTIDVEDRTAVEILLVDNDEDSRIHQTISDVISVGFVTDATSLLMPREKRFTKCPRCGFEEVHNSNTVEVPVELWELIMRENRESIRDSLLPDEWATFDGWYKANIAKGE